MKKYDVVIVGAGPAGAYCALSIKERNPNIKIAIIEKGKPLNKLLLSGGGRCNFTNKKATANLCLKYYPRGSRFISSLFYKYDCNSFINWLNENNINIKEEEEERFFLKSEDSKQIVNLFLSKLKEYKVDILKAQFKNFNKKTEFEIELEENGKISYIESSFLVIATGSDKNVLNLISTKGVFTIEFIPSLFGLKSEMIRKSELAGVSVKDIVVKIDYDIENIIEILKTKNLKNIEIKEKNKFIRGDLLFTHRGVSGPAILKLSSYYAEIFFLCDYKCSIQIDFFPQIQIDVLKKNLQQKTHSDSKLIKNINYNTKMPNSLWLFLLRISSIDPELKAAQINKDQIKKLSYVCKNLRLEIDGKDDNKDEFVSAYGVDLKEIDNNCQIKKIENLYIIGELLNIDGITGGYNLQCSWTTAFVCANSIVKSFSQNPQ